jgi:hypothetical protein
VESLLSGRPKCENDVSRSILLNKTARGRIKMMRARQIKRMMQITRVLLKERNGRRWKEQVGEKKEIKKIDDR